MAIRLETHGTNRIMLIGDTAEERRTWQALCDALVERVGDNQPGAFIRAYTELSPKFPKVTIENFFLAFIEVLEHYVRFPVKNILDMAFARTVHRHETADTVAIGIGDAECVEAALKRGAEAGVIEAADTDEWLN